jgi:glycosyltransferase involved in cell wall biosynthesis
MTVQKPLRIIVLCAQSSDSGSYLRAQSIAESLNNAGASVKFIDGIKALPYMMDYLYTFFSYLRILFIPCDIIIGIKPYPNITLVMLIKKIFGSETVIDIDDMDFGYRNGILSYLIRLLQIPFPKHCSLVTYHSENLYALLINTFNINKNKLYQLRQGINIYIPESHIPDQTLLQKYSLNKEKTIIYPAHINIASNLDAVLEIIKRVHQNMQEAKLLIIGGGPMEKYFRKYVKKNKMDSFVIFTGYIAPKNIQKYFLLGNIGIIYYKNQSANHYRASMKLREMLAFGLKIVCNNIGDLQNFHEYTYQTNSDYDLMTEQLLDLLKEGGDNREQKGKIFVRNNLCWSSIGKEFYYKLDAVTKKTI